MATEEVGEKRKKGKRIAMASKIIEYQKEYGIKGDGKRKKHKKKKTNRKFEPCCFLIECGI